MSPKSNRHHRDLKNYGQILVWPAQFVGGFQISYKEREKKEKREINEQRQ
jgi:hypothetical protein